MQGYITFPASIRPHQIIDAPCSSCICSDRLLLRRGYVHHDFRRTGSTGLGAGYLCQRRWKAYRITSVLATTWFILGAVLGQGAEAADEMQNQLVELGGLVALAAGTAVEAGLAVKKARSAD